MLERIIFKSSTLFPCFKKGFTIDLFPGINILAGDQGTGKSTILKTIFNLSSKDESTRKNSLELIEIKINSPLNMFFWDSEKDNPRIMNDLRLDPTNSTGFVLNSKLKSHGEVLLSVFESILKETISKNSLLILLDEPETALSLRSIFKLIKILKTLEKKGHQLLISTHHPLIMENSFNIFSLETWDWLTYEKFIETQNSPISISHKKELKTSTNYIY